MAASALRELATTAPTDLLDGHRLQDTYRLLESAHLVPANNDDEIQMLHSLFNVAISHGIGRLVTDYLTEVCALGGARSASNHPHSPLTDPDCMRQWLRQSLATVRQQLTSLLSHGLASISGPGAVAPLVHQLGILNLVAQALKAHPGAPHHPSWPVSNINAASAGNELFLEAQRLSQCAAVLQWLGQVRLRLASPTGRFPSHEAWTTTVELRRSGVGSSRLFVDDFLDDLAQHVSNHTETPAPRLLQSPL